MNLPTKSKDEKELQQILIKICWSLSLDELNVDDFRNAVYDYLLEQPDLIDELNKLTNKDLELVLFVHA